MRTVNDEIAETVRLIEHERVLMDEECAKEKDALDSAQAPYKDRIKAHKLRLADLLTQDPRQGTIQEREP